MVNEDGRIYFGKAPAGSHLAISGGCKLWSQAADVVSVKDCSLMHPAHTRRYTPACVLPRGPERLGGGAAAIFVRLICILLIGWWASRSFTSADSINCILKTASAVGNPWMQRATVYTVLYGGLEYQQILVSAGSPGPHPCRIPRGYCNNKRM
ncbi:hypothetical protein QTO34_015198 [Cnephaeus nilssonii]|uniref:Uncharacterized protein n=1 Tax=Cnephaeus nilssonii TaxID=3371016 RepID=A0AA40LSL3_CNENI|nr:hypothetical protein QTO34_015198 [Eptesicus nilssonii]